MLRLQKGKLLRITPARVLLLSACSASIVVAQVDTGAASDPQDPSSWKETDQGIPVTDALTIQKCGTCHAKDEKGNLSRISWVRSTPEGWSQTIKRMVKLNGASLTPDDARSIVQYLSTYHGLAPEEAKTVMYIPERRVVDETSIPNDDLRQACAACHAFGQPLSSRRSKREWALLQNMHVALYSQAEAQYSRPAEEQPARPADEGGPPPKPVTRQTVALNWLAKNATLNTPEWAAWRPRIRAPKLEGKWLITASLPGHGRFFGEMTVSPGATADSFKTATTLRSLDTGKAMTREGKGLVYSGYSWRGVSGGAGTAAAPDDLQAEARETMWFAPDQSSAQGRWYWGEYHEFGYDVSMVRETGGPALAGVYPYATKTGAKALQLHIYGANLPAGVTPADLDLGAGLKATGIVSAKADEIVATVDVAPDATPGLRDIGVKGAILEKALPVYSKVDFLKVTPETALAHLGGIKYAKGYGQFDVIGFANGPDGKPNTPDDFAIGPVDATWRVEEFPTVTYDDDIDFVGKLSPTAFFTPSVEGPNPKRRYSRNNYGEVWVVATAKTEKDSTGKPLSARAYLVVTVPTYKRWDQPEVSE
jgi:quinohemoprotein amine dehydrogenase